MKYLNLCSRRTLQLIAILLLSSPVFAQQIPEKMSFQAVVRDASNGLVMNKPVGIRVSILRDTLTGSPLYVETHTPTSNANGLVTFEIGGGTMVSGVFSEIPWDEGKFNIKLEADPNGGTSYGVLGLSPLLSVPYAIRAKYSLCCNVQWNINGNSNTNSNSHYLGTSNNQALNFRVNNIQSGQIDHLLYNTFFGFETGKAHPSGKWNTGIGNQALRDNTTGHDNTAIGDETMVVNTTGSQNTALGEGAMFRTVTGDNNTASGYIALGNNTSGNSNVANGVSALYGNAILSNLVAVGDSSLYNTGAGFNAATPKGAGIDNTGLGSKTLYTNTTGAGNTGAGFQALLNSRTGNSNTAIGRKALFSTTTGSKQTGLGAETSVFPGNLNNSTAVGANALVTDSNCLVLGSINGINSATASTNVGIGVTNPDARLHIVGQIKVVDGSQGLNKVLTSDANGLASWQIPGTGGTANDFWALNGNTIASGKFLGTLNNLPLDFKVNNTHAGTINQNNLSTLLGYQSGSNISTGTKNTAYGASSLNATTTGHMNTAIGELSLFTNTTANANVAVGQGAMYLNTTGSFNSALGQNTLFTNSTGFHNTAVGSAADVSSGNLSFASAIGARAYVSQSNSMVLGAINGVNGALVDVKVGIGTTAPSEKLHVKDGNIRMEDGNQGIGKVLTSDANGVGSWASMSSLSTDWSLDGNTITSGKFLGTINGLPLNLRVNNTHAGSINHSNLSSFFGYQSGLNISTGTKNTAMGASALIATTTGHMNTAIGELSLSSNTSANANVALGQAAMYNNTTGSFNTSVGQNSLMNNTTGFHNTALGSAAEVASANLSFASAIGARAYVSQSNSMVLGAINGVNGALVDVKVGIGTTAPSEKLHVKDGKIRMEDGNQGVGKVLTSDANGVGSWASMASLSTDWSVDGNTITSGKFLGTINNMPLNVRVNNVFSGQIEPTLVNTYLGYQSGNATMTGGNNTAFGGFALLSNTTGNSNTAVGRSALTNNTTGTGNTANGYLSMSQNTVGTANTAFGNQSLRNNSTGINNTAVGYSALVLSNGSDNVAVGLNANQAGTTGNSNVSVGSAALLSTTTGSFNTAVGEGALFTNTTGNSNTALGRNANVASANLTNATAIGNQAVVCASNTMLFGNGSVTGWGFGTCPGSNAMVIGTNSTNGNGATLSLSGSWGTASDSTKKYNIHSLQYGLSDVMKLKPVSYMFKGTKTLEIGFIAQEVRQVIPEVVMGEEGHMTMSYAHLTSLLVKAMQEQQVQIENLRNENASLKSNMENMQSDIRIIMKQLPVESVKASK